MLSSSIMCIRHSIIQFILCVLPTCLNAQDTLQFIWTNDSIDGLFIEKSAMFIPVKLNSDTTTYYFQFDTGANRSSLYTATSIDTLSTLHSDTNGVKTNIGDIEFMNLFKMSPYYVQDKYVIGTIGADVLQNFSVEIDFLNEQIIFTNSYNPSKYQLHACGSSYGRPTLPIELNKKSGNYLFDTGSSIFELWTTKQTWKKLKFKDDPIEVLHIMSWGIQTSSYTAKFLESIILFSGGNILLHSASYNSSKHHKKTFKEAGFSGIIGNKPFLNEVILIDMQSHLFGVKKREP